MSDTLQQIKDEYAREKNTYGFEIFLLEINNGDREIYQSDFEEIARRYATAYAEWASQSGWEYYPGTQKWRNGIDPARTPKEMHDYFQQLKTR